MFLIPSTHWVERPGPVSCYDCQHSHICYGGVEGGPIEIEARSLPTAAGVDVETEARGQRGQPGGSRLRRAGDSLAACTEAVFAEKPGADGRSGVDRQNRFIHRACDTGNSLRSIPRGDMPPRMGPNSGTCAKALFSSVGRREGSAEINHPAPRKIHVSTKSKADFFHCPTRLLPRDRCDGPLMVKSARAWLKRAASGLGLVITDCAGIDLGDDFDARPARRARRKSRTTRRPGRRAPFAGGH